MTQPLKLLMVGRAPSYVPMVTNNWIMSCGTSGMFGRAVDHRVWTTYEHALIERYWKDPGMVWLFATNPHDSNFVHGWLCGEHTDAGPVVHYLYVRKSMRDSPVVYLGVAQALMEAFLSGLQLPVQRITHSRNTPAFERKVAKDARFGGLAREWFYNPYVAFAEFGPRTANDAG